ncbi:hypothetical protein SBRCBS47491_000545 [Sporothrix bragantina]|uniref:UBC core domain-containing protein n=1 Tax=Sporothrix bragantina TaxID=671064 RepID=A0ABP0AR80_9PEZI
MSDQSIIRIGKEVMALQEDSDLSLAVACRDSDLRNVRAMIIGPPDTPYEFGFFEFALKFSRDYPRKSPNVTCTTTNSGTCRFNPNIYSNGKVCLSILGTWRGERGEEWSAAQGLESILLSIQSLMSGNPYENEPGFEDANGPNDKKNQKDYVQKIRHETLRVSIILRLEQFLGTRSDPLELLRHNQCNPTEDIDMDGSDEQPAPYEPFKDLCKRRFLWYYDTYLATARKGKEEVTDGQPFARMPFEGGNNSMDGRFCYGELIKRLVDIKATLDAETAGWAAEGAAAKAKEATVAVNLARQFEQSVEAFKRDGMPHNIELENGNPFAWVVTYFGKPMTNLDGGLFRFRLMLSPRFPQEQPRARFETPIFHQRISADGTPCYGVKFRKRDDVRSHIEAIIEALEEENPPYDPRTMVHPEAHKLYWGSQEDRKLYNRKLRRLVQQSME